MRHNRERWLGLVSKWGYEVSSKGRVRSYRCIGTSKKLLCEPRLLSLVKLSSGYLHVNMRINGKARLQAVHSLVLEAFAGPRPDGMECRHLDGNPSNNHIDNLCWGTPAENTQDKARHRAEAQRLTPRRVGKIRMRLADGASHGDVARRYGISMCAVKEAAKPGNLLPIQP